MNTPKEERDSAFYQDAFTSSSTWGKGDFERFVQEIGFKEDDPDDFFGQRAFRLWEFMNDEQKAEFASNLDDWLDS